MKKVTITKATGVGVLTRADDGRWDMTLNGRGPGSSAYYYTDDQVERIVTRAKAEGAKVEVE